MKSKEALKEFEGYLQRAGHGGAPKTALAGFVQMLGFYKDLRVEDVNLEADGDMLLFQWGSSDWGSERLFELDLTRQLIGADGEDESIWQLHLTYRFATSDRLRALGNGDRWCEHPADILTFEQFVTNHAAVEAVGSREDGQVEMRYECAG